MDRILFLDKRCTFNCDRPLPMVFTPLGEVVTVSPSNLEVLKECVDGISESTLIRICEHKMPGVDPQKIINRLLEKKILEVPKPIEWESETYGSLFYGEREIEAITRVINSGRICRNNNTLSDNLKSIQPSTCKELERRLGKLLRIQYVLALNSGTSALECALQAIGIQRGDEVIVPCYTYIGTISAVMNVGGVPVLCDIDDRLALASDKIETKISENTKAILCVHLRGYAADMKRIVKIAKKHNLFVIEDCAQSIGTEIDGRAVGTWGDIGCFSFHEHKLISAGEGGAICTRDKNLFNRMELISDASRLFTHPDLLPGLPGHNYRMSELHAAVCNVQIDNLTMIAQKLQELHKVFVNEFRNSPVISVQEVGNGDIPQSVYLKCREESDSDDLVRHLNHIGVKASKLYSFGNINHNVYMCWPYVLEKAKYVTRWKCDDSEMELLFQPSLEILRRTVCIHLGLKNSCNTAAALACSIRDYIDSNWH